MDNEKQQAERLGSSDCSSLICGVGSVMAACRNGITAQRQYQSIADERVRFPPDSLPARKRISRKHGTRNWLAMRGSAACAIDNCGRFATCPVH